MVAFGRQGQASAALLAVALLGWAIAAEIVIRHTTWSGPAFDDSGYSTGLAQRDIDLLAVLQRLAVSSRALAITLGFLGPTLFVWSLAL